MGKDLHYLITRIINPYLNLVIAMLRSDGHVIHGRDGYTGLRWTDHTLSDYLASELEEWRNNLWYSYRDSDFLDRGKEIIDSLLEILIKLDAKLPDDANKYKIMDELWEMVGKVERYLELDGYIASRRDYFNTKVEEIRKQDEELRKKVQREKKKISKIRPSREHKSRTISRSSSRKLVRKYVGRRKRRISWKNALGFVFVFLMLFALWDLGYNDGKILSKVGIDINKTTNVVSTLKSKIDDVASALTCSNSEYSIPDAIRCYLNDPEEMAVLEALAKELKRQDIARSASSILIWEESHIEYDVYQYYSKDSRPIQKPSETIRRGKGVCVDYAVLTAGLLLSMNYSPVYVFDIDFENNEMGHASAAIKFKGYYYMMDQHPPLMGLKTYYNHWATYGDAISRIPLYISEATVYEVKKENGKVVVQVVEILSKEDFLSGKK